MNINAVQPVESIYLEEGLDDISGKIQGLMRHHRVITENEYAIGNSVFLLYHDYHGDRNQCYTVTFCIHAFNADCSMIPLPDNGRMACSECTNLTLADTWKSINQDNDNGLICRDFILDTEEHHHDGSVSIMVGTV